MLGGGAMRMEIELGTLLIWVCVLPTQHKLSSYILNFDESHSSMYLSVGWCKRNESCVLDGKYCFRQLMLGAACLISAETQLLPFIWPSEFSDAVFVSGCVCLTTMILSFNVTQCLTLFCMLLPSPMFQAVLCGLEHSRTLHSICRQTQRNLS